MVQGTREDAAWKISKNGFGTVASLDDGYYGRGIYFSSKLKYANLYAKESKPGEGKVFLVNLVIIGNPFPVIEHPFQCDQNGKVSYETLQNGENKQKINPKGFYGQVNLLIHNYYFQNKIK